MSQENSVLLNDQKADATIAIKAAQKLGEYATSNDGAKETELIELLSKRPSLMQRLFPTKGQAISQELMVQRLRQLANDQMRVQEILNETYTENLKIIANVNISKLRTEGLASQAEHYEEVSKRSQKVILESQNKQTLYLRDRLKQAKIDFPDPEDEMFLESVKEDIKTSMTANRKSTDRLINEFLGSLDKKFT